MAPNTHWELPVVLAPETGKRFRRLFYRAVRALTMHLVNDTDNLSNWKYEESMRLGDLIRQNIQKLQVWKFSISFLFMFTGDLVTDDLVLLYYTPSIYAEGYIAFVFPFVRSCVRMLVHLYVYMVVRSFVC